MQARTANDVISIIAKIIQSDTRNVKLLDLGSPKNKLPVTIEFYNQPPMVCENLDQAEHKQVFETILGSVMGLNKVLAFNPTPLLMEIVNCPNLKQINLGGGFAVMIREENPFTEKKPAEQPLAPTRSSTRDETDTAFLGTGFRRGFLLGQNTQAPQPRGKEQSDKQQESGSRNRI